MFQISSEDVSQLIVQTILSALPEYYQFVLTSTLPWMKYYNLTDSASPFPFQWGPTTTTTSPAFAAVAQSLSHFSPSEALTTYGPEQVFCIIFWFRYNGADVPMMIPLLIGV